MIDSKSNPKPAFATVLFKREVITIPPNAASRLQRMNVETRTRSTGIPARRAASLF
jgi:hypothetical protein